MNYPARMLYFGFLLVHLGPILYLITNGKISDNSAFAQTSEHTISGQETATPEKTLTNPEIGPLNLPQDPSPRYTVKQLQISGNTLISTEQLLKNIPLVYNASDKPAHQAEPGDLYDLRVLHNIIQNPGSPYEVSRRTMQGLTQYILSVYQNNGYAGIYVYISAQATKDGVELQNGILPIEIVETKISEIIVTSYDPERNEREKGILKSSVVKQWSPVKIGQVANKKKMDDFVNLLNLNPDRYVAAVISRGAEPDTLALGYDIYEASPWHYYIQLDNAGSKERQWAPRVGLINTNITGRDDRITAIYQAPLESDFDDNYSMFGSYEFPLFTPRLRLNLYGGRSEFDTSSGAGVNFLGKGSFYGGILRLNVLQKDGWFLDVINSLSHEHSKVTPSLFLGSDVNIDLWTIGADLHHSDDMSNTSFGFTRTESVSSSSQRRFWDPTTSTGARTNAERHFKIYTFYAARSQYLEQNKIQRLSGSFRHISPDERLAPSKMTVFGGLYSVRGYKEDEIIADGGTLISAQYEFDLIQYSRSKENNENNSEKTKQIPWFSKLAPLAFTDFARAKTKHPVPGEKGTQQLCSVGLGIIAAIGDNFDAGIYYGHPLISTEDTNKDNGRWSFSFTLRW